MPKDRICPFLLFAYATNYARKKVFALFQRSVGILQKPYSLLRNNSRNNVTKLISMDLTKNNKSWWNQHYTKIMMKSISMSLFFVYVIFPIWFYFCPWIRRQAVFLNNLNWPLHIYLSDPKYFELNCTRQFYVESEPGIRLGVWHMLPKSVTTKCNKPMTPDNEFNDDRPVILYFHGNAQNRAAKYRLSLYKVLTESKVDAHVITFDYRGFGDSSFVAPSVNGLVQDARAMYKWLKSQVKRHRIFFWGHSLGTGVVIQLAEELGKHNDNPMAIFLEAPFTTIADATYTFPLSFLHRHMPLFHVYCSEPTRHSDTNFDSESKIGNITVPLLFLHASDDMMVFLELGRKLFKKALEERPSYLRAPEFIEFDYSLGYGHRNINLDPNLPDIVLRFMQSVSMKSHQL
uniref:Putative lipase 1 n=1 Tax=Tityus serrulatus TaxID=6887 RepID=A0A7S8MV66_TITSE|nr:putative lipase 1 [Tityus serrulatus]